jgi:hypothetical protein
MTKEETQKKVGGGRRRREKPKQGRSGAKGAVRTGLGERDSLFYGGHYHPEHLRVGRSCCMNVDFALFGAPGLLCESGEALLEVFSPGVRVAAPAIEVLENEGRADKHTSS